GEGSHESGRAAARGESGQGAEEGQQRHQDGEGDGHAAVAFPFGRSASVPVAAAVVTLGSVGSDMLPERRAPSSARSVIQSTEEVPRLRKTRSTIARPRPISAAAMTMV